MPTRKNKVHRLEEMETVEISLVDLPANLRKFLVVKNMKKRSTPMAISSQDRHAVSDILLDSLEKIMACVQVIKDAETDGGAPMPEELKRMVAETITSLGRVLNIDSDDDDDDDGDEETATAKARSVRGRTDVWHPDAIDDFAEHIATHKTTAPVESEFDDFASFLDAKAKAATQRQVETRRYDRAEDFARFIQGEGER